MPSGTRKTKKSDQGRRLCVLAQRSFISIPPQVTFVDTEDPFVRMTVFVKDAWTVLTVEF